MLARDPGYTSDPGYSADRHLRPDPRPPGNRLRENGKVAGKCGPQAHRFSHGHSRQSEDAVFGPPSQILDLLAKSVYATGMRWC